MSGFFAVLLGNFLRLGSGMLVFVLLARWLGPSGFGGFAYWLAVATVATVPINYGLNTFALREFGARPNERAGVMAAVMAAKQLLSFLVLILSLSVGCLMLTREHWWLFAPLLVAQIAESFSEFYTLSFRAGSAYKAEATTASVAASVHLTLVLGATWALGEVPQVAAAAFALSRLLGLMLTRWRAHQVFEPVHRAPWRHAFSTLSHAWAYALEFALSTAYAQLDVLVIEMVAGLRAVGLYQAGMKLVQGASRLAPIMALYVLPRLTRQITAGDSGQGLRHAGLTLLLFCSVGAGFGGVLALGAEPIAHRLFGAAYVDLPALLPWFGLLLLLRFTETGMGLVLVAVGLQSRKTGLVALQLAIMLLGGAWAMHSGGLKGWLVCSVVATTLLLLSYVLLWLQRPRAHPSGDATP